MIGINKFSSEKIEDLDPSNESSLYYELDKREWEFVEEFSEEAGFLSTPLTVITVYGQYDVFEMPIYSLTDLMGITISASGHFIVA